MNHLPFLRAIAQAPHDDLPRLVYADALEESGVPELVARAHFIRGQIALAGMDPECNEFRKLHESLQALKSEFEGNWVWNQMPVFYRSLSVFEWTRGFVESLEIEAQELFQSGRQLFDTMPILDLKMNFRGTENILQGAFESTTFLNKLTTLRYARFYVQNGPHFMDNRLESQQFDTFMKTKVWRKVTSLHFSEYAFDDSLVGLFAETIGSSAFTNLNLLSLSDCSFMSNQGVKVLLSIRCLSELKTLRLWDFPCDSSLRAKLIRRFGERVEFNSLGQQ